MTAPQPGGDKDQHFWILTMMTQLPEGGGWAVRDLSGTATFPAHFTRNDAFMEVRRQFGKMHPEYSEGTIIAFVLESNVLPWLPGQDP